MNTRRGLYRLRGILVVQKARAATLAQICCCFCKGKYAGKHPERDDCSGHFSSDAVHGGGRGGEYHSE